nr:YlcI/YnfO family protein [Lederbergia galactosidilytica]
MVRVIVEVSWVSESSGTTEIMIRLPQQLIAELDGYAELENVNRNEFIYRATKMYLRERRRRQIVETMRRGYMEMAKINLAIASEAIQAEYEAENTVERLVSGG